MKINVIDRNNYVISEELHETLRTGSLKNQSKAISKTKNGLYLVSFRMLNNDKKVLVYNYIYYDQIFLPSLLNFLAYKDEYSIRFREWGSTLVVVDKSVYKYINEREYDIIRYVEFEMTRNANIKYYIHTLEPLRALERYVKDNENAYFIGDPYKYAILHINTLNVLLSYNEVKDVFKHVVNKDYCNLISKILYPILNENKELKVNNDFEESISIMNSTIFLVSNLDNFVRELRDLDYSVNEGPQSLRGQVNSINALLNNFDYDYRRSLLNHNMYHVKRGVVDNRYLLNKSHFSFKNIHMNIGNVKWYSTTKNTNLSDKLLKKLNKKSFKTDSFMYISLSRFIQESDINNETQISIERFLLDYSYLSLSQDKENRLSGINYELFNNIKLKKHLLEVLNVLTDYIKNLKEKNFKLSSKSTKKMICESEFRNILNIIDTSLVLDISMGIIARVISNFGKITDNNNNSFLNICYEMGGTIVNNYIYTLYKNFIKKNVILLCENCLDYSSNISNEEGKSSLLTMISNIKSKIDNLDTFELLILVKKLLSLDNIKNQTFNDLENIVNYTLSDWKSDNKELIEKYTNELIIGIGSILIDWLNECNLTETQLITITKNKRENLLIPHPNLVQYLDDNITLNHLPLKIPMIVKPKLHSKFTDSKGNCKEILGGYLLNDEEVTEALIIPNWELRKGTDINKKNVIYAMVNNLNSVGFKINQDLLEFINLYGDKLDLLLKEIDIKNEKKKLTKSERSEIESYISKLNLQENILGLAKVFSNVSEFFLPVRLDFRGRVNCISQYLNYQSTELAKALLLFSKPEKLLKTDVESLNYFKSYGANCFGNKLDKKSWEDRCKWVNDNEYDIINYTNCKLISQAENKLLFTTFCIEYNRWIAAYNNHEISYFETYLPIQLDATCNGYQHLSLLISDVELAKELNLTKSSKKDVPKDFYGFLGLKLIELFKQKLKSSKLSHEDLNCYKRLSNMLILRSTIKKVIMTIPYNVSSYQMINYLKEHFIMIDNKFTGAYGMNFRYKHDPNVILCSKDFSLIASGLQEVLQQNFPKLRFLIMYLKTIAKIFTALDLIISWGTTSGILVNQSYISSKEIKLRPFSYNKSSFTLKVPTKTLSGNKQVRAFMPNLIHSLDATALALLADDLFNSNNINNFYAIHDCFAVTANNIPYLITSLKSVYTEIYIKDEYLRTLDNNLRESIKYAYGPESFNEKTLEVKAIIDNSERKEQYPDIDIVLGTKLPNMNLIKDSVYLVS